MDRLYRMGPITLCMRNWPRDSRWPFALWRLDAYAVNGDAYDLLAEYDPDCAPQEVGEWRLTADTAVAKRMEMDLPDGRMLWKQVQTEGGELLFALSPDHRRVVLAKDTTATYGMAAIEALTFFAYSLFLTQQVLTFHSVLVEYEGKGVLLAAPSGVGKTTLARLWRDVAGALILNGDRSPCYRHDGVWTGFGTPWCGTSGENINRQVPIKALILLRRGEKSELVSLHPLERINRVLELALCPPGREDAVLQLLDGFLCEVPVLELAFTPDADAVKTLIDGLESL